MKVLCISRGQEKLVKFLQRNKDKKYSIKLLARYTKGEIGPVENQIRTLKDWDIVYKFPGYPNLYQIADEHAQSKISIKQALSPINIINYH